MSNFLYFCWELIRDNVSSVALFAALLLFLSPYQIWHLLTNNRPGRGSLQKMWLADRFIQIWLAQGAIDSSSIPFKLRMPSGVGDVVFEESIVTEQAIDRALESLWLVKRYGDIVVARRGIYLFMCNWLTYFFCKWYLILLVGDGVKYYENMDNRGSRIREAFEEGQEQYSHPIPRFLEALKEAIKEGLVEFAFLILRFAALFLLLFLWIKLTSWILPYLPKLIELIHFEPPQIKIPTK